MRYWNLSKILELTIKQEKPEKSYFRLAMITWSGFILTMILSIYLPWSIYLGEPSG